MDPVIYLGHSIPVQLPSYGIAQKFVVNPAAIRDPNAPTLHYYACVARSTGLARGPAEFANDPDIIYYGPFLLPAAPAMIYDMGLLLQQNRRFVGNFRPLARCVMAAIQNRAGGGSSEINNDPWLMMLYGGCIIDAFVAFFVSNRDEMARRWNQIILATFSSIGNLVNEDFENSFGEHCAWLENLRDEIVRAYEEKAWPDEVWPGFLAWLVARPGLDSPGPPELLPPCFQVLIGEKAIEEQVSIAFLDIPVVKFRTQYAEDLYILVEDQLEKIRTPGVFTAHIFFIKMIVFVLGRHFDNRETSINPAHRPSLFARYVGHIADALIECIKCTENNGGFQIIKKTYPTILQYFENEYIDGVGGSHRKEAMIEAFDEIVAAYNNRQWPLNVWWHLLETLNYSNPNLVSGSFAKMYVDSCGGPRQPCIDVSLLFREAKLLHEQDNIYEGDDDDDEIEDYDDHYPLDGCFKSTEDCCHCLGPSSISYTLKWICKSDHMNEGMNVEKEERFGPFGVMSGDCASRVHDEVKKVFPFATGFKSFHIDPNSMAPDFIVGSCLHFQYPKVVPMEFDNSQWTHCGNGIPSNFNDNVESNRGDENGGFTNFNGNFESNGGNENGIPMNFSSNVESNEGGDNEISINFNTDVESH